MLHLEIKEPYLENDYSWIWLADGVLFLKYKPNLIIDLAIAKKIVEDRLKVSNEIARPMLLDARNFVSMDRNTMKYYKTKEVVQYITAGAFLTESPLGSLAVNIYLKLEKPHVPSKHFTDEKKALLWLDKYKFLN